MYLLQVGSAVKLAQPFFIYHVEAKGGSAERCALGSAAVLPHRLGVVVLPFVAALLSLRLAAAPRLFVLARRCGFVEHCSPCDGGSTTKKGVYRCQFLAAL